MQQVVNNFLLILSLPNKVQIIMKKFSDWLVCYWWIWPVACIVFTIVSLIPNLFPPKIDAIIDKSGLFIVLFLLLMQLISFIFIRKKQEKGKALGCVAAGFIWLAIFLSFSFFYSLWSQSQPTGWAASHPIPEGLEYTIPVDYPEVIDKNFITKEGDTIIPKSEDELKFGDTIYYHRGWHKYIPPTIDVEDMQTWLQIWNHGVGGMYCYTFYYPELNDGTIYLKCFEVSKNEKLSAKRLKEASSVKFTNHKEFGKIADCQSFVIYEGDWGEYYAVRVEVWYHDPVKKEERMLMSKIYRMEGWMR